MEARLPAELKRQFDRFTQQLIEDFEGRVPPEEVTARAHRKLEGFHDARILNFLPLLVYRYTREDLAHMGQT